MSPTEASGTTATDGALGARWPSRPPVAGERGHLYFDEHNRDPKPFAWTADPDAIAEKVRRGYHASLGRQTG